MSGSDVPDVKKLSLWEIFSQLPNLILWDQVRRLAVRGTVPDPAREPVINGRKTAISGLFDLIEQNDGLSVIEALREAGHPETAHGVELMLKDYQRVPAFYKPVPADPFPCGV